MSLESFLKDIFTPKTKKIKHKDWIECEYCRGSVGESGLYCKNCGSKFVEVQNAK